METKIELMTFKEYFYAVNEDGKIHPDNAYTFKLEDYITEEDEFPILLNRFKTHGLNFEIREQEVDRWKEDYCDIDDEGNVLRDKDDKTIQLSQEKKEKLIKPRYKYEHAIVDSRTQKVIGKTQDEWNCLLITVADEYKGMSLGEKLLETHRDKYPFRYSGGHTPAGKEVLYRMYQNKVSKFLSNGNYSKSIKENLISKEKVKEILESAMIDKKHVSKRKEEYAEYDLKIDSFRERKTRQSEKSKEINYDMYNPEDILLHIDNNFAVLYNKKAFNKINTDDINEHFIEQGLLGYSYIGGVYGADSIPKLFRLYGKNEKIKSFMAEVAMNLYVGEPIRVFKEDVKLLNDSVLKNSIEGLNRDGMIQYELKNKTIDNLDVMSYLEKQFRNKNDKYDEKWTLVHEEISKLAENEYEKPNEKRRKRLNY
jgi:hypothetical protein